MQAQKPRDFPAGYCRAQRRRIAGRRGLPQRSAVPARVNRPWQGGHPMLFFRQPSGPIFPAAGASRLWR